MSEILKNLKWNMVVTAVLVIILGLILILYPGIAAATICLIVGWGLFIGGVVSGVLYLVGHRGRFEFGELILIISELALGLFVILNTKTVIWFLEILFAFILIIHGSIDRKEAEKAQQYGDKRWRIILLCGMLKAILCILIIWNPFSWASVLMRVIGIALVYDGISDLIIIARISKFMNGN